MEIIKGKNYYQKLPITFFVTVIWILGYERLIQFYMTACRHSLGNSGKHPGALYSVTQPNFLHVAAALKSDAIRKATR
jgi:hypothetical protein